MKRTTRWKSGRIWTGALALLFLGTTVFAQTPAPAPAKPDSEIQFRKKSQLSAAEMKTQAVEYITKMRQTLAKVEKLAQRARVEKDIIKLNCVNDKKIQVKGNLRLAEQTKGSLAAASARGDDGARSHEFSKLTISYQKVTVLGQEAEACIGEEIAYVGKTRVDVAVDRDIPQQDPTVADPSPVPTVRPPVASPFL